MSLRQLQRRHSCQQLRWRGTRQPRTKPRNRCKTKRNRPRYFWHRHFVAKPRLGGAFLLLFVFPRMYLEATGTLACWKLSMSRAEAMSPPPPPPPNETPNPPWFKIKKQGAK